MSLIDPNTRDYRNNAFGPDEVDTLLRNFFRAEMPNPWPTTKAPVEEKFPGTAPTTSRRWGPVRSRLALAASVALLIAGSWALSGPSPDYTQARPEVEGSAGSANTEMIKKLMKNGGFKVAPSKTPEKGCSGCDGCGK